MKKLFLVLAIVALTFISCKDNATETTQPIETKEAAKEMTMTGFACPMDCEKGKTYEAAGKCPVCEMDLVDLTKHSEEDHHHENHDGHDH